MTTEAMQEQIELQAADWLGRLSSSDATADTHRDFCRWLAVDPAHRDAAELLAETWNAIAPLAGDASLRAERIRARQWRLVSDGDRPRRAGRRLVLGGLAAACVAALAFVVAGGTIDLPWLGQAGGDAVAYRTGHDQRFTVTLADGSVVTLDVDTELQVQVTPRSRAVRLVRGEAFFAVRADEGLPFDVTTDAIGVHATGTEFAVRALGGASRVVLVEGKVQVTSLTSPGTTVALRPGQRADFELSQRRLTVRPVDVGAALAWRQGRLVFRATPLRAAIAEINRYAERPVTLAPELGELEITGTFETNDVGRIVRSMARILPVAVREQPDGALRLEAVGK